MFSKDKQAYLFLILTTLFWAGNFIVGEQASRFDIPPFTLNFYRWTFAWLILAPFTIREIIEKKNHIMENGYFMLMKLATKTIFLFANSLWFQKHRNTLLL